MKVIDDALRPEIVKLLCAFRIQSAANAERRSTSKGRRSARHYILRVDKLLADIGATAPPPREK